VLRQRAGAAARRLRFVDDEGDDGRAPICPFCGVTTLPAEISTVLDPTFVCNNEDCEACGDEIR
jgi:hypothetical protein